MDISSLVIIGLSAEGNQSLSAKFIKNGANDFLKKPFMHEEFYCRINHNLDKMELIRKIQDAANRDYLTGLYNRRYFYQQSESLIEQNDSDTAKISACIIDIDHFKSVNDNYGHDIGDLALKHLASLLSSHLTQFICARLGGEEFAVLFPRLHKEQAAQIIDKVRDIAASSPVEFDDQSLTITFSAGVAEYRNDFSEMLKDADEKLYRAKEAGRNIVIYDDED